MVFISIFLCFPPFIQTPADWAEMTYSQKSFDADNTSSYATLLDGNFEFVIFITPVALTDFIPKTEQAAAAALAVFAVLCRKIHFVDCMELLPASSACFIQTHSSVPAQNQRKKFSVFMNKWSQLWCLCSPLGVFSCFCVLLRERDILKQPRPLSATVSMSDWCKNGWRWDVVGS